MSYRYVAGLLAMLSLLGGCVTNPVTPDQVREYARMDKGSVKLETFEVQRPYAAVTQSIKQKSDACLNKTFRITGQKKSGFFGVSEYDDGTTKYIPVSNIGPNRAEFYTKFWDSKARAVNTPAGDKFVFYVAEVTPKGRNTSSIDLYYFTFGRYNWSYNLIEAWARGEDPGCPILNGMY